MNGTPSPKRTVWFCTFIIHNILAVYVIINYVYIASDYKVSELRNIKNTATLQMVDN